jgi:hypothetical protein
MRLVSGPIVYAGNIPGTGGSRSVQNYVYTVVAPDPGTYKIPAVTAIINGKVIKSNGLVVEVVAPADAERLYRRTPETIFS